MSTIIKKNTVIPVYIAPHLNLNPILSKPEVDKNLTFNPAIGYAMFTNKKGIFVNIDRGEKGQYYGFSNEAAKFGKFDTINCIWEFKLSDKIKVDELMEDYWYPNKPITSFQREMFKKIEQIFQTDMTLRKNDRGLFFIIWHDDEYPVKELNAELNKIGIKIIKKKGHCYYFELNDKKKWLGKIALEW